MFYLWNIKIKVWQGPRGPSVSPPLWLCGIILSPICQDALKGPRWSFFTAFWVARIQHFLKVKLFGGRCGGRGRSYRKFPILSTDPINSPQMVILNHSNNSAFPCKRLSWSTLPLLDGSPFGLLPFSHPSLGPFLSSPGFVSGCLPAGTQLCGVWGPSRVSVFWRRPTCLDTA